MPVTRLSFSGNKQIVSSRLEAAVRELPDPFDRDFNNRSELFIAVQEAERRIEALYHHEGYLFARIDSENIELAVPVDSAQGYAVRFEIAEGLRYTLHSIVLTGLQRLDSAAVRARMQSSEGRVLGEAVLKSDIDDILKAYSRQGLPFARIDISAIDLDTVNNEPGLTLRLAVHEGKAARIDRIVIEGNTSTDREVIMRELRIPIGSVYDPVEVERARSRLERLGYFENIADPDIYLLNDSSIALVVRVKEANTSEVDGVLGYNPGRTAGESGYLSGLLELSFRNISGSARDAMLHYARENQLSQQLEVRYLEPWLFGYPLDMTLDYAQRQQDSSFTRTKAEGAFTLAMKEDLSIAVSAAIERVIPTDLPNYPFTAYDSRSLSTGISGSFDSRDNADAPRSGVRALLGASYARKTLNGPARFLDSTTPVSQALHSLAVDAAGYHTLFGTQLVGVLAIHGRSIATSDGLLDESDMFRLGGVRSIRGYREAELLASRYAYGSVEVRVMTERRSFFFGFLDGGVHVKDSSISSREEQVHYPVSYGLGTQLESPLGLITVSIALPKGEPIDQAKLHFGLVKQF